mmetsp:Transcript_19064/g.51222  ORF Transcript_19064/g.51222 Transcript_19064/m.51222 type:complete len:170 (-) Transcript_19064:867-1376(-)
MQPEDAHTITLDDAHDSFSRAGHEQHKLLAADGYNTRLASISLMDRLLTAPRAEKAADADTALLAPVIERTGFSADEAGRTILLWEEISTLRQQGLDTVEIVQHLTKRLRDTSQPVVRGRGHLTESGRNAAETLSATARKQKLGRWADLDNGRGAPGTTQLTQKRTRLQ